MIFEQLIQEVCERLNLTSDEAKSRIGRDLNSRYRRVTSSIGLETSRRTQVQTTAQIGSRTMTFYGIEKILAVIDKSQVQSNGSGQEVVLSQITVDEMHITPLRGSAPPGTAINNASGMPRHYAVTNIHPDRVDIIIDCIPATTFTLYADGQANVSTLKGGDAPDFPESFHDVLVFGAMADEYRKMEKLQFAQAAELDYEKRLSDLRMWIAKSAYLDIHQGRYTGKTFRWTRDAQLLWDQ